MLITKSQISALLSNLPASCAMDAAHGIEPPINANVARFALLGLEQEGCVSWNRQAPQLIALTPKGRQFLKELQHG